MVKKQDEIKKLQSRLEKCSDLKEKREIRRELRALGHSGGIRKSHNTDLRSSKAYHRHKVSKTPKRLPKSFRHLMSALQRFHNIPRYYELLALIVIDQSHRAAAQKPKKSWDYIKKDAHQELKKLVQKYRGENSRRALMQACGGTLPKSITTKRGK